MAAIDGVVFQGIDAVPFASVKLLTPSGHVVAEQTATIEGEFRFVVPNGVWGIEAGTGPDGGDHTIAVRDVIAMEGERMPVYVRLDTGERTLLPRRRPAARKAAAAPAATAEAPEAAEQRA